jgi:metallo-beta-lactamase family protein
MGQAFEPLHGWTARFTGAGHILGAASLLLEVGARRSCSRATWAGPTTC